MNSIDRRVWRDDIRKRAVACAPTLGGRKRRPSMSFTAALAAPAQDSRTACTVVDSHSDARHSCASTRRTDVRMDWIGILAGIGDSHAKPRAGVAVTDASGAVDGDAVAMNVNAASAAASVDGATRSEMAAGH